MIKVNVEVNNKPWHTKIKNPKKYFNKKLKKISKIIPFFRRKNVTFTIFLTNSLGIKRLNKKFRKQNKPTDVLSFPSFLKKNLNIIMKKICILVILQLAMKLLMFVRKKLIFS